MFFKKACFAVLLVLLAQIVVMRKLNRNKNKKQPKPSYRGYARKYAKASSVVPTSTFQPKFYARAIIPEVLSTIDSTMNGATSIKKTIKENTKTKTAKATKVTKATKATTKASKPTIKSKAPEKKKSIVKTKIVSKSKPTSTIFSKTKAKPTTSSKKATKSKSTKQSTIKSKPSSISKSTKAKPTTTKQIIKSTSSSIPTSSITSVSSTSSSSSAISSETNPTSTIMIANEAIADTPAMVQPHRDNAPKSCYQKGKVTFTQYWIPIENQWDEDNHGQRVFLGGNEKVDLLDKNGTSLAIVPVEMHRKCKMEGTCLLENGDIINIDNTTDSFLRVGTQGRENNIFGLGSGAQNLVPFVSVASNDLPYGQKLYIKQLDGLDLGKGRVHNGCVRVDDDSWSFKGCQIDLFVLSYVDYLWLDLDIDRAKVQFIDCELRNYVLKEDMETVKATNKEEIIPSLLNAQYVEYNP